MIKIMGKCNYLIHIITSPPDIKDVTNDASAIIDGTQKVLKINERAKKYRMDLANYSLEFCKPSYHENSSSKFTS